MEGRKEKMMIALREKLERQKADDLAFLSYLYRSNLTEAEISRLQTVYELGFTAAAQHLWNVVGRLIDNEE